MLQETFSPISGRYYSMWYSKGLNGSTTFRGAINQSNSADEVRKLIDKLYEDDGE